MGVNLYAEGWLPIPGYEGAYFICKDGKVCNLEGHIIKPSNSKSGLRVELRKDGQREKPLIVDLLKRAGYID